MFYQNYSQVKEWPFKYFKPAELASKGDGSILVDMDAIARLESMREMVGKPLKITSGYRDPIHNAKVGGAPLSMHKFGRAFDISLAGHDANQLEACAKRAGFGGIAKAKTFIHVDTGRVRTWTY